MDLLPTRRSLPRQNGIFKCGDGWAVLEDKDKPFEERRIFNVIINPSFIVRILDKLKMEKRNMQFSCVLDISAYFKISISNANKARYEPIQVGNSVYIRVEKYPKYTFIVNGTDKDKKLETIVGHYLLNENGLIISAEVKDFSMIDGHLIPSKILTIWHQENVILVWTIKEIRINNKINPYNWQMPYYNKKINMGTD